MSLVSRIGNYRGPFAGTTDGATIPAGQVGERLVVVAAASHGATTATGSGTGLSSLANNTAYILQSSSGVPIKLSLTAGVWDIYMANEMDQASKVSQAAGLTLIQNGLSTNPTATSPSDFERSSRRDLLGDSSAGMNTFFYARMFQNVSAPIDVFSVLFVQGSVTGLGIGVKIQAIRIA